MRKLFSILITLYVLCVNAKENPNVILPEGTYPHWPAYIYVEDKYVTNIKAQEWKLIDHNIDGWDWSLPGFVKPSVRSSVGLQRNFGWTKEFFNFNLQFPANPTGLLWLIGATLKKLRAIMISQEY